MDAQSPKINPVVFKHKYHFLEFIDRLRKSSEKLRSFKNLHVNTTAVITKIKTEKTTYKVAFI